MRQFLLRYSRAIAASALLLATIALQPAVPASATPSDSSRTAATSSSPEDRDAYATGWSFYMDNDFFSFGLSGDRGYTGGFALTLNGRRAAE